MRSKHVTPQATLSICSVSRIAIHTTTRSTVRVRQQRKDPIGSRVDVLIFRTSKPAIQGLGIAVGKSPA